MNIWLTRLLVTILVIIFLAMVVLMGIVLCGCASAPEQKYGYRQYRGDHCELCGAITDLSWAHGYPQNMAKGTDLEYLIDSPTNGVTLCMPCHRVVGHYNHTGTEWNTRLLPIVEELKQARKEYR